MSYETEKSASSRGRCLECGDDITYGRSDRKFCCEHCKNKYNNRKIRSIRSARIKVNSAIDRNYRILDDLLKKGISSIGILDILSMGYSLEYMTSCLRSRYHQEFRCYDIRYQMSERRVFGIERIEKPAGR